MIAIGRWTGFSIAGKSPPEKKRSLFERWARATLAQESGSFDWVYFVCLAESLLVPAGALAAELRTLHDLICDVGKDEEIARRVQKLLGSPASQFAPTS